MRRPPHPGLRRLWAVGGRPAVAAARLEAVAPRLEALARDYGTLPLLSDRLLAAVTRTIDLGVVLDRATEMLGPPATPLSREPGGAALGAGAPRGRARGEGLGGNDPTARAARIEPRRRARPGLAALSHDDLSARPGTPATAKPMA